MWTSGPPSSAAGATSYSSGYTAGVAGVIADMLPPGHSAADVVGIIKGTVTPHAQSVGAWSTTGGVINPAGAVADGDLEGRVAACRRRPGRDLRRRCLLSRRDGLLDLGTDRHRRIAQPGTPGRLPDRTLRQFHLHPPPPAARQSLRRAAGFRGDLLGRPRPEAVQRRDQRQPGPDQLRHLRRGRGEGHRPHARVRRRPPTPPAGSSSSSRRSATTPRSRHQRDSAPDLALGKPAVLLDRRRPRLRPGDGGRRRQLDPLVQRPVDAAYRHRLDLRRPRRPYHVSEVRLNWEAAYAVDYQVQLSDDAVHWVAVKAVTGNQAAGVQDLAGLVRRGPLRPHLLHQDQRRLRQLLAPRPPGLRHPGHRPGTGNPWSPRAIRSSLVLLLQPSYCSRRRL